MAKLPPDITIRIKSRNGPAFVLELSHTARGRCMVRRDGKRSAKMAETTPTQIGREIGKWLSCELPKAAVRNIEPAKIRHGSQR